MYFGVDNNISSEDDDDEIVEEIPVYLSKKMHENLFVFQYPHMTQYTYDRLQQVSECQFRPKFHEVRYNLSNKAKSAHRHPQTKEAQISLSSVVEKNVRDEEMKEPEPNDDFWTDIDTDNSDEPDNYTVADELNDYGVKCSGLINDKSSDYIGKSSGISKKRKKITPFRFPKGLPLHHEKRIFLPNFSYATQRLRKLMNKLRKKKKRGSKRSQFYKEQAYIGSPLGKESNTFMVGMFYQNALHLTPIVDIINFQANCRTYGRHTEIFRDKKQKAREDCPTGKDLQSKKNVKKSSDKSGKNTEKEQTELMEKEDVMQVEGEMDLNCSDKPSAKDEQGAEKTNSNTRPLKKLANESKTKEGPNSNKNSPRVQTNADIWRPVRIYPPTSDLAEEQRQKLLADNFQPLEAFSLGYTHYAEKVLPGKGKHRYVDIMLAPRAYNQARLAEYSLLEQVQIILKDGKMMTFREIMNRMNEVHDPFGKKFLNEDDIVPLLNKTGRLVHGNWIPQSEIVYVLQRDKNIDGIPVKHLIRSRDYVVKRTDLIKGAGLPVEELMEILTPIAHMNSKKLWVLNMPPDEEFLNKYPDIAKEQNDFWTKNEQIFKAMDNRDFVKQKNTPRTRSTKEKQKATGTDQK